MSQHRKTVINGEEISFPDGVECGVKFNRKIGYVSLQYVGTPVECYEAYKVIKKILKNCKVSIKSDDEIAKEDARNDEVEKEQLKIIAGAIPQEDITEELQRIQSAVDDE